MKSRLRRQERYIKLLCAFTELVGLQPAGCFTIRSCRCGDVHPLVGIVSNCSGDCLIPLGGIGGEAVGVGSGGRQISDSSEVSMRVVIELESNKIRF